MRTEEEVKEIVTRITLTLFKSQLTYEQYCNLVTALRTLTWVMNPDPTITFEHVLADLPISLPLRGS